MSFDSLDDQIKEIILLNGGDIDIANYPNIIKEAEKQGLSRADLARKINKILEGLDLRPFREMDNRLEEFILKGIITEKEAEAIITEVSQQVTKAVATNYITSTLRNRKFEPRYHKAFEHDSFKNLWMTDEVWDKVKRNTVIWLGKEAHSLEELGTISYQDPTEAKYYLQDANSLVPIINRLTGNPADGDRFSKIINNERNIDNRYYRVLYSLNPQLEFRLNTENAKNIYALLDITSEQYSNFKLAADFFSSGFIPIWIELTDTANAKKLPPSHEFNDFLKFIYSVKPSHPFFLNSIRFSTPELLVKNAQENAGTWQQIAAAVVNQSLLTWFQGIGRQDWVDKINNKFYEIDKISFYTAEEKNLAVVQFIINLIDTESQFPSLALSADNITMLQLEGSKPATTSFTISLSKPGFTKAHFYLDPEQEGISLSETAYTFWRQNNDYETVVNLNIDTLKLLKSKLYSFDIKIDTEFENLLVPVKIEVVFPKKAFILQLVKYGVSGAFVFALIRFLAGSINGNYGIFSLENLYASISTSSLQNMIFYFVLLCLLVAILISSVFFIRKIEKI
ncbi:MAG TPA: hypothetical protein VIJ92_15650 [Ginsengibacter sp.]